MTIRPRTAETFRALQQELIAERAGALTRIGRRLERLLASLDELGERCRTTRGEMRARARDAYRSTHAEARRYRWYVEVQREAIGLHGRHRLDEWYPLPPATPPRARR